MAAGTWVVTVAPHYVPGLAVATIRGPTCSPSCFGSERQGWGMDWSRDPWAGTPPACRHTCLLAGIQMHWPIVGVSKVWVQKQPPHGVTSGSGRCSSSTITCPEKASIPDLSGAPSEDLRPSAGPTPGVMAHGVAWLGARTHGDSAPLSSAIQGHPVDGACSGLPTWGPRGL